MKLLPDGYWKIKENRIKAIKELIVRLQKSPKEITAKDFKENRLRGLLTSYYSNVYEALTEAGFDISPWEMKHVPHGYWKERENRINAIKRLVENFKKPIEEISQKDFQKNRLGGILANYYKNSPYLALRDSGFEIEEWQMKYKPQYIWKNVEKRVKAIQWLVNKLNKNPEEVTARDFMTNRFGGLLVA